MGGRVRPQPMFLFIALLAGALVVARWFNKETPNLSLLVLLVLGLGVSVIYTRQASAQSMQADTSRVPRIPAAQALEAVTSGRAVLVDVRSSTSFANAHLVGALNVSFPELRTKINQIPSGRQIIAYCS